MVIPIYCINSSGQICICPSGGGDEGAIRTQEACSTCPGMSAVLHFTASGMTGYMAKFNGIVYRAFRESDCVWNTGAIYYYSGGVKIEAIQIGIPFAFAYVQYDGSDNIIGNMYAFLTYPTCIIGVANVDILTCAYDPYGQPSTTSCSDLTSLSAVISNG